MTSPHYPGYCGGLARLFGALICLLALAASLRAADLAPVAFDLPAERADLALKRYSDQAGVEVIFSSQLAKEVTTKAVKGTMTASDALDLLLAHPALGAGRAGRPGAVSGRRETGAEAKNGKWAIAESSGRPGRGEGDYETNEKGEKVIKLDTFEVMAGKVLNMDIPRSRYDARPYVVFHRDMIDQSGAQNLNEFFKQRLSMNTTAMTGNQDSLNTGGSSNSSINLRGLGANQTLILVDGRRIPSINNFAQNQGDLNGIPLSMVERIEVLPSTASAIYGGGATGGVVNVILRRDYIGAEVKLSYENSFDTDVGQRRLEVGAGFSTATGKTNVLLTASWADSTGAFLSQDADYLYERGVAAMLQNNPGFIFAATAPPGGMGTTANIRSANGSNLVLKTGTALNSPITFAPEGYAGAPTDGGAALVANAGTYNLSLLEGQRGAKGMHPVLSYPETISFGATIRSQINPILQGYLDFSASNSKTVRASSNWLGAVTLPVNAPTNPFTTPIVVRFPLYGPDEVADGSEMTEQNRRATAGLLVQLPRNWKASLDLTWGRTAHWFSQAQLLSAAGTAAFTNGTLDALRDPFAGAPLSATLFSPMAQVAKRLHTNLLNPSIRFSGPVISLPAGDISLSTTVDYRAEELDEAELINSSGTRTLKGATKQAATSGYVEVTVPVVSKANRRTLVRSLNFSLTGRFERYITDGANFVSVPAGGQPTYTFARNTVESFDPSVAVRYEAVDGVTVRTSYGTGFLPPSVSQLVPNAPNDVIGQILDPRRGNETVGLWQNNTGGRPGLASESSKSFSTGVILESKPGLGLRVSIDYTNIKKRDNIATFPGGTQALINNEALFPDRVRRGMVPPGDPYGVGPIISIDSTLFNIARTEVEVIDLQIDKSFETDGYGVFELFAIATRTLHFKTQTLSTQPLVENVGVGSGFFGTPLKMKLSGGLTWSRKQWRAGWNARYFDSYVNSNATAAAHQGTPRVASQHYHDIFVRYQFRKGAGRNGWREFLHDSEIQVSVLNVYDTKPPLDMINTGSHIYYSRFGDPRGAVYQISAKKRF